MQRVAALALPRGNRRAALAAARVLVSSSSSLFFPHQSRGFAIMPGRLMGGGGYGYRERPPVNLVSIYNSAGGAFCVGTEPRNERCGGGGGG